MNAETGDDDSKDWRSFIATSSDVAGGIVAAAIGFLAAGPPGAIGGAVAGPIVASTVRNAAEDFAGRTLSSREQAKVASTIIYAATRIEHLLALGYTPREDGFFRNEPADRAAAEEVAEGVLFSAMREHEERKLPFYGNLLAHISFRSDIDRATANLLIRNAEALSYRQCLFLNVLQRKSELGIVEGSLREEGGFAFHRLTALQDIYDLCQRGLVFAEGNSVILDIPTLSPGSLGVMGLGKQLYLLMGLESLEESQVLETADLIRIER